MKFKKCTALLLSAVMLAGCFAGCGKDDGAQKPSADKPSKNGSEGTTAIEQAKYAYKAEYLPLATEGENGVEYVQAFAVNDNALYYVGEVMTKSEPIIDEETGEPLLDEEGNPVEDFEYDTALFRMDLNTQETKKLSFEKAAIPEGMMGNSNIESMVMAQDGSLWVMEQVSTYTMDVPEGVDADSAEAMDYYQPGENSTVLSHLDAEGKSLASMKLDLPEGFYPQGLFFDSKNNIYVGSWDRILVFDPEGKLLMDAENDRGNELSQIGPDLIGFTGYSPKSETNVFYPVDLEKKALGDEMPLADGAYQVFPGFGEYDYLYSPNNESVFGHIKDTDKSEKLLNWLECDVDNDHMDRNDVSFQEDGSIVAMERSYEDNKVEMNVILLSPVDRSELPQKKELTLACIGLDWTIRPLIIKFNRAHDDIRIVVRDYGETITNDRTYDDAVQTLNTEILSGNVPDLMMTSNLPVERYAAKGLIQDLWPLIDGDKELGREDLMEHFFDVLSTDGKLYQLATSFNIQTAAVKSSVADGRTSWTLGEVKEALSKLEPGAGIFSETADRDMMLTNLLTFNLDSFLNWEEKSCSFDTPEFIEILEFANSFAQMDWDNYDYESSESEFSRVKNGKQLMHEVWLSQLQDVQVERAFFNSDVAMIGYPTSGEKGSAFTANGCLSISSTCKDLDAAWSFARELLLDKNQMNGWGFPTNRHAFDKKAKEEMTPDYMVNPETGEKEEVSHAGIGFDDDFMVELYAATQEDYDLMMDAYNSCNSVMRTDLDVINLVKDEAKAFFAGQKTAEETAKLIQDRVGLYMMEQG